MNTDHARRARGGFTLIEILVALAFTALAAVPIVAMIREDVRLVRLSGAFSSAAQSSIVPASALQNMAISAREIESREIELGPIKIQSVLMEIRDSTETDSVRIRMYR